MYWLIQMPSPIQRAVPRVKAVMLPVNTQRALCFAASIKAVKNDLSPIPAIATVANAVVNPATEQFYWCIDTLSGFLFPDVFVSTSEQLMLFSQVCFC